MPPSARRPRLRSEGHEARAVQLDVSDRARTGQVMDEHAATYGGLDICFANAGLGLGPGFWNPAGHRDPRRPGGHLRPPRSGTRSSRST